MPLVKMILDNLDNFNVPDIPDNCELFTYEGEGNIELWYAITTEAYGFRVNEKPETFFNAPQFDADSMFFLYKEFKELDGMLKPIGTATAWSFWDGETETEVGSVSWVAVIPDEQGQGYGKYLTLLVISRLKARGFKSIILYAETEPSFIINMYEDMGFHLTGD